MDCGGKADYAALVCGRGEVVKPFKARNDLFWLLVFPGVHSSTPAAYAWVDEERQKNGFAFEETDMESIYALPPEQWNFVNDFTSVITLRYDAVKEALDDVRAAGALFCDMSGSGSTVFGVFADKESCLKAQKNLNSKWKTVSL